MDLNHLIKSTHFAMAQQDIRSYLNGMLLEVGDNFLRAVATDGHRLALSSLPLRITFADKLVSNTCPPII